MDVERIKAAIEAAQNPKPVAVPGVHLLGDIFVRVNTAAHGSAWRDLVRVKEAQDKAEGTGTGRLVASILCDQNGALLYDPANDDHARSLAGLPDLTVAQIINAGGAANYPRVEATPQGNG